MTTEVTPVPAVVDAAATPSGEAAPAPAVVESVSAAAIETTTTETQSATLLGDAAPAVVETGKAPDPAPTEVPGETEGVQAADEGVQTEQAPAPVYDPFVLPDNLSMAEEGFSTLTGLLAEAELAKGDHAKFQEFGQKLVDLHLTEMNSFAERVHEAYTSKWTETQNTWRDMTKNDPELGGNRIDTTLAAAQRTIREIGGTPVQQAAFSQLMEDTGLGNHPVMIGFLARAASILGEPSPVTGRAPATKPLSRAEKMYGKQGKAA